MKADPNGTPVERCRAEMGWKTALQQKAAGTRLSEKNCGECAFSYIYIYTKGDESTGCQMRCVHRLAIGKAGMVTRETATCDKQQRRAT